ncbi:ferrochelatase [Fluviicola taffensis]|uniref:Ferrochelatase n=1 Tax=Fluviicola taffensis (strain DSM 16823 / NCIMB 13979 / RW262) TaxID=755732 RepID=F2IAT7_FLUTR|nr:ferrochelatase [Fluviicola taffensis]AEA44242.1 ferrochelatase [Fluviicola taffensis DSM 16823]
MSKKIGVLLIQLGTPDSPKNSDVRRYLKEFLMDPRVIDIPFFSRLLLVRGIIVPFRTPKSAKIYKQLWDLGNGKSPLLTYTESVKSLLQKRFDSDNVTIEMAMRYQNPSMDSVLDRMHKANYDQLIILPLFPQYASASTGSAVEKAMSIIKKWWVIPEIKIISQFYNHEGYIDSIIERAKEFDIPSYDKIMFSYHGLPERQVDKVYEEGLCTDHDCEKEITEENKFCYKATSYETTRLIAAKLGLTDDQYIVSFQSRLDEKWIQPFSDKVIEQWGKEGNKRVLAFSPAFVADCLETLIEIGGEYQEIFEEHGGEKVQLVPSSNDHPRFIDCLEDLVRTNF